MKKRILACLLALVMIIGILPVMTLAEDAAITPTADWYDAAKTELEISSAADLLAFAKEANDNSNTFEGKKITLKADIDLGDMTWTPVKSYKGEFDGNGKTISNFELNATEGEKPRGGFFNGLEAGSKVHDLTLEHVKGTVGAGTILKIENAGRIGTLANYISGEVESVTVRDINVTTTNSFAWVGGLCAFMSWPAVKNCTVENLTVNAENGAAFIAGFAPILQKNANFTFENCNVKDFKVTVINTGSSECGVGGFVVQTQRGWEQPKIVNCNVTGIDITASGNVDIGGFIAWPGAHTIVEECTTEGTIDATGLTAGTAAGGFFANLGWNCDLGHMGHEISGCTANVDITTDSVPAGGFVGSATNSKNSSMYATFTNCMATGSVNSLHGPAGGFAGIADRGVYIGCSVSGAVSGEIAGGFIGKIIDTNPGYDGRFPKGTRAYLADLIKIENCSVVGRIFGTERVCGLIGEIGEKDVQDDAVNGHVIVSGSSVSATLVRATEDVPVYEDLYKVDNNKPLDYTKGTCTSKIVTPETGVTLTRDEKNEIEIPVGTEIRDSGVETPTQLTGRVLPDGSIVFDNEPGAGDGFLPGIIAVIGGSNQPFSDVAGGAYYNEAVRWAVKYGIASGTDAKHFSPDAACTRGQAVTFLWRAAGSPAPALAENPFTDVKPADYCYDAVLWAVQTGVAKGTSATMFSPDAPCTRGQIVTFLYRAAGSPSGYANSGYVDVPETSYCAAPVAWAVALRVTSGTSALTFSPDALCTRAQIVTFLYRANA